jgi:hypothetical protein
MTVQVFGVDADGGLWHTVRGLGPYRDMDSQTGIPWTGNVLDAACAMDDEGNLHVLVVTDCVDGIGRLWHTVRAAAGGWTRHNESGTSFGDVGQVVGGERGNFKAVAAYTLGLDLHVLAATDNDVGDQNKLWHAVREPIDGVEIREGGTWSRFKAEGDQGQARKRHFSILESVGIVQ